jgi:Cytochrome P450
VDTHIESLNETNPRDWLDLFLIEINKIPEKQHIFTKNGSISSQLKKSIINFFFTATILITWDLIAAGIETSATSVTWFLPSVPSSILIMSSRFCLIIAKFPEIQEKVHKELQTVLKGRLPTLNDKDSLPYLNAVIKEVSFIISSSLPLLSFTALFLTAVRQ